MSKASGRLGRKFLGSDLKSAEEGSSATMSEELPTPPPSPGIHIHVTTVVEQEEERAVVAPQSESRGGRGFAATRCQRT